MKFQKIILVFAGMVPLIFSGCLSASPVSTEGVENGDLGAFTFAESGSNEQNVRLTSCESGDFFLGADFADESQHTIVRLVIDPIQGPAIRIFDTQSPNEKDSVFWKSDCPVFNSSLEPTGWRVNHSYDYRIILEVECSNAKGNKLKGKASSVHCH